MDPTLARMTNWIVYHLARGEDYTTILPLFEREFGRIPRDQYDVAFSAAALAEANAGNLPLSNPRQLIRNAFRLPGGPFDTVEIRVVCRMEIIRTRGGVPYVAAERFGTQSFDMNYGDRVGDIYATAANVCQSLSDRYEARMVGVDFIPGIYWPGLD